MGYKKKKRETNITIVNDMLMHGFTNEEIAEFTGIIYDSVKTVNQNYFENNRVKYIKTLYKRLRPDNMTLTKIQSSMYSINEMDYGYSGQQKVLPEDLKGDESVIYNEIKDFGLKHKFKIDELRTTSSTPEKG